MWWKRKGVYTLPGRVDGWASARCARKVNALWFINGRDFVFAIGAVDTVDTVGPVDSIGIGHFVVLGTGRVRFLLCSVDCHAPGHERARSQSQWLPQ